MKALYTISALVLLTTGTSLSLSFGTGVNSSFNSWNTSIKTPSSSPVLDGYLYNGGYNQLSLKTINADYNMIDLGFDYAVSAGLPSLAKWIVEDKPQIIDGIKYQHELGHKVLLSIGGENDKTEINSQNLPIFISQTLNIIQSYGLDGLDFDIEGNAATSDAQNFQNIPIAIQDLKQQDNNLIITLAPQWPLLSSTFFSNSIYLPIIKQDINDINYVSIQAYNQFGASIKVTTDDQSKFSVPASIAENNVNYKAEFLYLLSSYLTTDNNNDGNNFQYIPANKLLLGLPATTQSANEGYVAPDILLKSFNYFKTYNLNIPGLMTWNINQDNLNKWAFAMQSWGKTWGAGRTTSYGLQSFREIYKQPIDRSWYFYLNNTTWSVLRSSMITWHNADIFSTGTKVILFLEQNFSDFQKVANSVAGFADAELLGQPFLNYNNFTSFVKLPTLTNKTGIQFSLEFSYMPSQPVYSDVTCVLKDDPVAQIHGDHSAKIDTQNAIIKLNSWDIANLKWNSNFYNVEAMETYLIQKFPVLKNYINNIPLKTWINRMGNAYQEIVNNYISYQFSGIMLVLEYIDNQLYVDFIPQPN